jgi:hypothetical protein
VEIDRVIKKHTNWEEYTLLDFLNIIDISVKGMEFKYIK